MGDDNETKIEIQTKTKFTKKEKINMALFMVGIMSYKFAFESIGVSIALFVLDRLSSYGNSNTILANLVIAHGLSQSIGSAISGGMLNRFLPNRLMVISLAIFTSMGILYNLLEVSTGGTKTNDGNWNPWIIFPLYMIMGLCLGILETCRRTISASIVGTDEQKLKEMDAMVHIIYEVGGTLGAFISTLAIKSVGYVYSTGVFLFAFMISIICYACISISHNVIKTEDEETNGCSGFSCRTVIKGWFLSLKLGAKIVFSGRKFIWLIPCYVLPLVIHRLYENVIFPFYAKNILKDGSFTGIMLSASNFGELLGALLVLKLVKCVKTPIPWIRVDAIMMFVIWSLVYIGDSSEPWKSIGILIPLIIPVSLGWSAGDVSLLAHIQSKLSDSSINDENTNQHQSKSDDTRKLNAVMGFLYTTYIFFITFIANGFGVLFDKFKKSNQPREGLFYVAGITMSILAVIIFVSTFIPPRKEETKGGDEKERKCCCIIKIIY